MAENFSHRLFYLITLGCKVNQYESCALRESWVNKGFFETREPGKADIIVVNSCAVTARAEADTRAAVRRLHRAAPKAAIVVTGCAVQTAGKELACLPGVRRVVRQSEKTALLGEHLLSSLSAAFVPACFAPGGAPSVPDAATGSAFPAFSLSSYDRTRAVLKIQDGCSQGCRYCIVPLTRGGSRSRLPEDSLAEASRLLESGFCEIMVSGVNLRQYREQEIKGQQGGFWDFLARLDTALAPRWGGRARLRISSLDPGQCGQKALDTLANCRMVAPHLHLSLQSGCVTVLRRMGRGHYNPAALPNFLQKLRTIWPIYGLGADLLTAFPGETEEEFMESEALCQALPLTYGHVFPYSKRLGTIAAAMPGHVPSAIKKERAARLRFLVQGKKLSFLRSFLKNPGQMRMYAIFEARQDASVALRGVNEYYCDCRLSTPGSSVANPQPGELVAVNPVAMRDEVLLVEPRTPTTEHGRKEP